MVRPASGRYNDKKREFHFLFSLIDMHNSEYYSLSDIISIYPKINEGNVFDAPLHIFIEAQMGYELWAVSYAL